MNRYLVKLIYQIICGEGRHTAQFDEQLRLVTAEDEAEALQKSRSMAVQEEDTFYNDRQQLVQWKFVNVAELYPLDELSDGAEVFSQLKETDDPQAYSSFVHHKAGLLRKKYSFLTPQTV